MNKKNTFYYLLNFLWDKEVKIRIFLGLFLLVMLLFITLNIITPFFLKDIINSYQIEFFDAQAIVNLILLYSFLWIFTQFLSVLKDIILYPVMERAIKTLNFNVVTHVNDLPHQFYTKHNVGTLINSLERVHTSFQEIVWGLLVQLISPTIMILIASTILYQLYEIKYALLLICLLVTYIVFTFFSSQRLIILQKESNQSYKKVVSYIVDVLSNFDLVKYFCAYDQEKRNLSEILNKRESDKVKTLIFSECIRLGQWSIIGIFFILINYSISLDIVSKKMKPGDFALINSYIIQFFIPLSSLGITFRNIRKNFSDLDELLSLLNMKTESRNQELPSLIYESGDIEFSNVYFEYESGRPVIKNVSFIIPYKSSIAIIGPSGSGKTSISKILYGLYKIKEGAIYINGQDITRISLDSLQKIIALVPQEPNIFHNTILYNIKYGKPDASYEEVEEAAKLANLDSFIKSLPEKYNTMVGPRGITLSGGEKQRIAIARAILKHPKILIFDEATSALDYNNEQTIQRNIENLKQKLTLIVITHRPSTAKYADKILILENGIISHTGTHSNLLESSPFYWNLWEKIEEKSNGNFSSIH